jgi:hypothetical protein
MLSVSVFDAAIELAKSSKLLLSEALSIRARALAGQGIGEDVGGGLHWDDAACEEHLAEVMGRMKGPTEELQKAFAIAPLR